MDKLAEEEEEEALALQKHMAASLEEQDFDAADFEVCLYSLHYMNQGVCLRTYTCSTEFTCIFLSALILQVTGMSKSQDLFLLITYRTCRYFNSFVMFLIAINNSIV